MSVIYVVVFAVLFAGCFGVQNAPLGPGAGAGWALHSGKDVTYVASQTPDHIHAQAIGTNPTGGWKTELMHKPSPTDPLRFELRAQRPQGMVTQAITRFDLRTVVAHKPFAHTVTIVDARGEHTIKVDQARD